MTTKNTQCYCLLLHNFSFTGTHHGNLTLCSWLKELTLHLIKDLTHSAYSLCRAPLTPAFISLSTPSFPDQGMQGYACALRKQNMGIKTTNSLSCVKRRTDDIKAIRSIRNNRYKLVTKELML